MAFYYITVINRTQRTKRRQALLSSACRERGIDYVAIDPRTFDYTTVPQLKRTDFLYRGANHARAQEAVMVEKALLNDQVTTFYRTHGAALRYPVDSFVLHSQAGIPIPKTIWSLTRDVSLLRKAVESLGGFPVVVKILGASRGLGVIRADSWPSLISIVDYLVCTNQRACLREFIDVGSPAYSQRAIVIGEEVVIACRVTQKDPSDFRSNAGIGKREWSRIEVAPAQARVLVQAVHTLGIELGAIDFVERENGELVIFEVNFPFRFLSLVTKLKFDFPGTMLDYLQKKSGVPS